MEQQRQLSMEQLGIEIVRLPIFRDNYVFVVVVAGSAICVDPGEAKAVQHYLATRSLSLTGIWLTHHHPDHVGGVAALKAAYPHAQVYGAATDRDRLPTLDVELTPLQTFHWQELAISVLPVPAHTSGHIAYSVAGQLFCGDALFAGGCGRLFEGTPAQLLDSLNRLRQLPEATQVWCAHEYTESNLHFALTVEPDNRALQERYMAVCAARADNQPTIPTTIGLEKLTNPFLRWESETIQQAVGSTDPVRIISRLRGRKDLF